METENTWPQFGQRETPHQYAEKLRTRVFTTQTEAARYFGVHRSTINKREKPEDEGGVSTMPPLGYLAHLVVLFVERNPGKAPSAEDTATAQGFLLQQINKLLEKYQASYNYRKGFQDWDELSAEADKYRPRRVEPPGPPPVPKPYLVPDLPVQGVFGRDEALTKIEELMATRTPGTGHVTPVVLRGFGGIGKTTLATSIGRRRNIALLYPDGVLWAELGPEPTIRQLLTIWGDSLDLDLRTERDEAACEAMLRNALAQRRMLLIVDDVWDPNHARHFLLGGPNCRSLLTTRELKVAYDLTIPERTFKVDFLDLANSLQMLEKLASKAVALDRRAAVRLCTKLDGLPLAIRLAGQLLAVEADVPSRMRKLVDELIERREARLTLTQSEHRLGLPEEEPPSLQAILGMSVERLSPIDKERFAMLAVFGGEPLTWEIRASTAVWKCSIDEAEETMSHLIRRALVELRSDGRYWMHQLLADYAGVLLDQISA